MCLFYSWQAQIVVSVASHGEKKFTRFILVKKDDQNLLLRFSFTLTKATTSHVQKQIFYPGTSLIEKLTERIKIKMKKQKWAKCSNLVISTTPPPQFILLNLKISVSHAVFHLSLSVFTVSLARLFLCIFLIQISEFNNHLFRLSHFCWAWEK